MTIALHIKGLDLQKLIFQHFSYDFLFARLITNGATAGAPPQNKPNKKSTLNSSMYVLHFAIGHYKSFQDKNDGVDSTK